MIGIDTNILVRYIVHDDPLQSPAARRLLEQSLSSETPGFVSLTTVTELFWVLTKTYGFHDPEVALVLEGLLASDSLIVQNEKEVSQALNTFKQGLASFADALIGQLGQWANCTTTYTFDRRAAKLPGFRLL